MSLSNPRANTPKFSKVFVYYPRGARTGGPEALHQLVDSLRSHHVDAYLVPFPATRLLSRHPAYGHYDAPEVDTIEDARENAVIVPEIYLEGLKGVKTAQRMCWWLSIDNSQVYRHLRSLVNEHPRKRSRFARWLLARPIVAAAITVRRWRYFELDKVLHLAQSQYAWAYLYSRHNITASALSDYTVGRPSGRKAASGIPVIAYNPKKGGIHVEKVRATGKFPVDWLPITGMDPDQVAAALTKADVYLDLGHQPGKDRLPREAANAGAVSIVVRRGAGAYSGDVPVPPEHKVSVEGDLTHNASRVLAHVLQDLERARALQQDYRDVIAAERATFAGEVHRIFVEGQFGSDHDPLKTLTQSRSC